MYLFSYSLMENNWNLGYYVILMFCGKCSVSCHFWWKNPQCLMPCNIKKHKQVERKPSNEEHVFTNSSTQHLDIKEKEKK